MGLVALPGRVSPSESEATCSGAALEGLLHP